MENLNIDLKILLIDKDQIFAEQVKNIIKNASNGIRFSLNWQQTNETFLGFDHDIFMLDISSIGDDLLIDIIEKIQQKNKFSNIIVMGNSENHNLFKNLLKLGIKSFVEKNEDYVEKLFHNLKEEAENKFRILKLKNSIKNLDLAKNGIDTILRSVIA